VSFIVISLNRSSFAKFYTLWNKASRSTQAADHVEEVLKRKLIALMVTRCNSYFDAVLRIIESSLTDLNELYTRLELGCFSERELSFLKRNFIKCLTPLPEALIFFREKISASGVARKIFLLRQRLATCIYAGRYLVESKG